MNLTEACVLGYLHKWCCGAAAARSQETIARHLREAGLAGTTARDVRDAAAALALGRWPVGTSSAGCFLCVTARDFRVAYRNLYGRLIAQAKRCRVFKETARAALSGQRALDFAEGQCAFEKLLRAPLLADLGGQGGAYG